MNRIKSLISEFKTFAIKGNAVELAIGVIIGNAFNKIVTSLINFIITPLLSMFLGKTDIANLQISIPSRFNRRVPIGIKYGLFLQAVLDFLTVSLSIFVMIKIVNKFHNKQDSEPKEEDLSSTDALLTEIRDLLIAQKDDGREK